jgi:predicted DNA-binding transcriptional regulator AlpA
MSDRTVIVVTTQEEALTERLVSERYPFSPRTLQRLRAQGGGPRYVRLGRRRIAYRPGDIETWLSERTFKSRADELAHQMCTNAPVESDR